MVIPPPPHDHRCVSVRLSFTLSAGLLVTYGLKCHIYRITGLGAAIFAGKTARCFHHCTVHGNYRQLLHSPATAARYDVERKVTSRRNSLNMLLTFTASSKSTHRSLTVLATIVYYGVFYLLLEKYNTIQYNTKYKYTRNSDVYFRIVTLTAVTQRKNKT